ncbi:ISAs1 family transposase [Scytonema sp. PRP1]
MIAVKDNQPTLHRYIKRIAALRKPVSRHLETEKTRDRFITRSVEVFNDLTGISPQWTGIKSLIRVERVGTRTGKAYRQVVHYISSIVSTAKEFACGIRGHWSIENNLHWLKDVVLNEDNSTIRMGNAPANLSVMRAIAQGAVRSAQSHSMSCAEMVILPSQLLKDLSLMILTNFLPLWNQTALPSGVG